MYSRAKAETDAPPSNRRTTSSRWSCVRAPGRPTDFPSALVLQL